MEVPSQKVQVPSRNSEEISQFIASDVDITEDLEEDSGAQRFLPVDRNRSASPIGMLDPVVATFNPGNRETDLGQSLD
jgi:hypothetical protein